MRKFHLTSGIRRAGKTVLAFSLAVAMSVPGTSLLSLQTVPEVEAEAAELPEPVASLDFEKGFQGEAEKNGLSVVESEYVLKFEEKKDGTSYPVDENGNQVFELTDTPCIEDSDYKKGPEGNQPTTYYDDNEFAEDGSVSKVGFGNVLMLDQTKTAPKFIKTVSDELDDTYPVYTGGFDEEGNPTDTVDEKSVLQEEVISNSMVEIKNPFAGMTELVETPAEAGVTYKNGVPQQAPTWHKGVTISYWTYVPESTTVDETTGEVEPYDSVLLTFQNNSEEEEYTLNDLMKYRACQDYGKYEIYEESMYNLGTRTTVTDPNTKKEYNVAEGIGPLIRFNPDYEGTVTNKIYYQYKEGEDGKIDVSWTARDGSEVRLVEIGKNLCSEYNTFDIDAGSKIQRGVIQGSMQIAASNSFHFKEDSYRQWMEGNVGYDEGALQLNKNVVDTYNQPMQFRHYNLFYFEGDGIVNEKEPGQWHYVTCVIMNDWVDFYVDGEWIDASMDYGYHGEPFGLNNSKKYFNLGYGARDYYLNNGKGQVSAWSVNGTASDCPANGYAQTIMEWLTDEETKLYIGGQGSAAKGCEQEYGTTDGVLLDDIKFYAEPFDEEQAIAAYEAALADKGVDEEMNATKDMTSVPAPIQKYTFDGDAVKGLPGGFEKLASNESGRNNVDDPSVVNYPNVGHVLKTIQSKGNETSALKFANPFKGMDIEGATVSYWVKLKNGNSNDGITVSFVDEPKVLVHAKIQASAKEEETRTILYAKISTDAMFSAGLDTPVYQSLKNDYKFSTLRNGNVDPKKPETYEEASKIEQDKWNARMTSTSESWHFVTEVVTNAGIKMYFDGEKLSNNLADSQGPVIYGPRFYDGYYCRALDAFAKYRLSTGNQTATPLMTFLTQEDTSAYIGFAMAAGSKTQYLTSTDAYLDDISFYAEALNDAQVKTLYAAATAEQSTKTTVAGEDVENDGDGGEAPGPVTVSGSFTDNGNGTYSAKLDGYTLTVAEGVIADVLNASVKVSVLGESDEAATYAAADAKLATISNLSIGKRYLLRIEITVNGQPVTLNGDMEVIATPYTGYTASRCSVVRIADSQILNVGENSGNLVFNTNATGDFAVVQAKDGDAVAGNIGTVTPVGGNAATTSGTTAKNSSSTSGSTSAGKTGDAANAAMVLMMLLAAASVVIYTSRKRRVSE